MNHDQVWATLKHQLGSTGQVIPKLFIMDTKQGIKKPKVSKDGHFWHSFGHSRRLSRSIATKFAKDIDQYYIYKNALLKCFSYHP